MHPSTTTIEFTKLTPETATGRLYYSGAMERIIQNVGLVPAILFIYLRTYVRIAKYLVHAFIKGHSFAALQSQSRFITI